MEWGRTLCWVFKGSAAGLLVYVVLVAAVYLLVPLESEHTVLSLLNEPR